MTECTEDDAAARTESVFSATAATYDPARARLIPCFAPFYAAAVALLPDDTKDVLDLGAGTGLLSAFVRERFPKAYLAMVDSSEPMLRLARARFAGDQQTRFLLDDYTICDLGTRYDVVLSALSIHHLPDTAKRALLHRVYGALRPGGLFVNADQILQPTPALEEQAKAEWFAEVRRLGASDQEIADSLLRQQQDRCSTVETHLVWLSEAGFHDVHCCFRDGRFAVFSGRR